MPISRASTLVSMASSCLRSAASIDCAVISVTSIHLHRFSFLSTCEPVSMVRTQHLHQCVFASAQNNAALDRRDRYARQEHSHDPDQIRPLVMTVRAGCRQSSTTVVTSTTVEVKLALDGPHTGKQSRRNSARGRHASHNCDNALTATGLIPSNTLTASAWRSSGVYAWLSNEDVNRC